MRSVIKPLALAVAVLVAASASAQCVSTVAQVSIRGVTPSRAASAVAWSGSTLGVVKVDERLSNAIYFATYDASLAQRGGDVLVASSSFSGPLTLIWTGREFGLFFVDRDGRLQLQRINADGVLIGANVPVLTRFEPSNTREYDVAWDAARQAYLIGHTVTRGQESGLWFSSVSEAGVERFSQQVTFLVDTPTKPQIAVNAAGVALMLFQRTTINYAMLFADGHAQLFGQLMTGQDARVGSDGQDFAVVATSSTTTNAVRWLKINAGGTLALSERTLFTAKGIDAVPVDLMWNPSRNEWALSYLDAPFGFAVLPGELHLRRFTQSGTLVSDSPFALEYPGRTFESSQPFAWNGTAYVTAVSRQISQDAGTESFLTVNCPVAPAINPDRRVGTITEPLTFSGVASGGAPGYTYTWDFGDGSLEESGQTVKHRYGKTGTYTVVLRVTDSTGGSGTTTTTVTVVTPKRRAARR